LLSIGEKEIKLLQKRYFKKDVIKQLQKELWLLTDSDKRVSLDAVFSLLSVILGLIAYFMPLLPLSSELQLFIRVSIGFFIAITIPWYLLAKIRRAVDLMICFTYMSAFTFLLTVSFVIAYIFIFFEMFEAATLFLFLFYTFFPVFFLRIDEISKRAWNFLLRDLNMLTEDQRKSLVRLELAVIYLTHPWGLLGISLATVFLGFIMAQLSILNYISSFRIAVLVYTLIAVLLAISVITLILFLKEVKDRNLIANMYLFDDDTCRVCSSKKLIVSGYSQFGSVCIDCVDEVQSYLKKET